MQKARQRLASPVYVRPPSRRPLSLLLRSLLVPLCALVLLACRRDPSPSDLLAPSASASPTTTVPTVSPPSPSAPLPTPSASVPSRPALELIVGGDIELGRAMGQRLLREPGTDPLATLDGWLRPAHLRFANLEGPLSDQHGETISPRNPLVFTGPPSGAEALARAGFDLVSTANNHAWDYGLPALRETLTHLDRAGVQHVGTGADLDAAQAPVLLTRAGWRIGFLAATAVWNQGSLAAHPGRQHVAAADASWLLPAVRALRPRVDVLVVSVHGGDEYQPAPLPGTRKLHTSLIEAGADVVVGHHPHVLQGIGWQSGRPIFHSLGNLLMQMHRDHPETGLGLLARLRFEAPGAPPAVALCPFRMVGLTPRPLAREPDAAAQERVFVQTMRRLQSFTTPATVGPLDEVGCAPWQPAESPRPGR